MADAKSYEQEFAEFMTESAPALAQTAWLLTGDEHQAEELVQEALTRTFANWRKARRDPLSYARKMLAGRRLAAKRSRFREPAVAQVPDQILESGERSTLERDRLARALSTLSDRQRKIVVLRHLMALSEQEVADDLGISIGTVKSTASRALSQLRSVLENETEAEHQL
ncbi:MAG: SigE family RNA polymerase sigma factor [Promicromonosporaceae bacterium]|nr:SigE family RNA polymerase sigma factor [Promicromonosporaceae bacterium]